MLLISYLIYTVQLMGQICTTTIFFLPSCTYNINLTLQPLCRSGCTNFLILEHVYFTLTSKAHTATADWIVIMSPILKKGLKVQQLPKENWPEGSKYMKLYYVLCPVLKRQLVSAKNSKQFAWVLIIKDPFCVQERSDQESVTTTWIHIKHTEKTYTSLRTWNMVKWT